MRDFAIAAKYWVGNWCSVLRMAAARGPREMMRRARTFEWMAQNPNQNLLRFIEGRSGVYREAVADIMSRSMRSMGRSIDRYFQAPERTIVHEDLVPSEIFSAMGLNTWMAELLGILVPAMDRRMGEAFIDVAENYGIPPDVCSLPKLTIGMALCNQLPMPVAVVASNMPCDGGMSSYTVMARHYNVPVFRLDVPHNFYEKRANNYFVGELKRMIQWLEEHTPGKMDWDRLRDICEQRNRAAEYELELWDMVARKPAALAAEPVYFSHLIYMCAHPGTPEATAAFRSMVRLAKKNADAGKGALKRERFRMILWNPPTLSFPDLNVWAEQKYGVANVMDMLTFNRHPFIDTSSPDSMLRDLADIIMQGPMARHTRGPCRNFFEDLFYAVDRFCVDMIWMAGHIGCKNTMALSGMFREKCRQREVPLCIIRYDLADARVVSQAEIRAQIDSFMETVMKA